MKVIHTLTKSLLPVTIIFVFFTLAGIFQSINIETLVQKSQYSWHIDNASICYINQITQQNSFLFEQLSLEGSESIEFTERQTEQSSLLISGYILGQNNIREVKKRVVYQEFR